MTPHICIDSWAKPAQGWIQGGAKIGPGGSLLQRTSSSDTGRLQLHTTSRSIWEEVLLFFVSLGSQIVDAFWTSVWT